MADNQNSRLDQLEARMDQLSEQLRVLTHVVANLTTPKAAVVDNGENSARKRRFSALGVPMTKILEKLKRRGLLEPLAPKPLPKPMPRYIDLDRYCRFHRQIGHDTDECTRLKHEIQDLIDAGKIPDPERGHPDVDRNPLPDHHAT